MSFNTHLIYSQNLLDAMRNVEIIGPLLLYNLYHLEDKDKSTLNIHNNKIKHTIMYSVMNYRQVLHRLITEHISEVMIAGEAFYAVVETWNGLEWWLREDEKRCHKGEGIGKSKKVQMCMMWGGPWWNQPDK